MYLSHLIIKNYRSIEYLCIPFCQGKNVIVGKNNAGKSNIVKAINLVLGEKYPTFSDIDENDFYSCGEEVSDYFWIICGLKGEDIDIEQVKNCKGFWVGCLKEDPIKRNPLTSEVEINVEHLFFNSDEYYSSDPSVNKSWKKNVPEKQAWAEECNGKEIFFVFYVKVDRTCEDSYFKDIRLLYKNDNDNGYCVTWGLSKQMRDAFITSAIVDSFRDVNKQLRVSSYSWYGKLMKKIWEERKRSKFNEEEGASENRTVEEELNSRFDFIRKITNDVFKSVSSEIQDKIDISFDSAKISFQFAMDNRADIHKNVQIYVDDGFKSHISDKGSGIQSAIIINLFSYYCYRFHKNTSLLVIEEPELYLHPQGRRALSQKLEDFIGIKDSKENQVILTTHSSEFISAGSNLSGIAIVKKENKKTVADHYSFDGIDPKELQTLLKYENSEMFFADKVIIVEGAEKYLLPIIADKVACRKNSLDSGNISIIRAGGKGEIYKYVKILKKCKIDYYVLADRDYFFQGMDKVLDEIDDLKEEGRQDMLDFAAEIEKNSIRGYKRMKDINDRILKAENSVDAKSLCDCLEEFSCDQNLENTRKVLEIWDYLKPKVRKKDVDGYMKDNNLYDKYLDYRKILSENHVWILEKGELKDYLTREGRQLSGGKEGRIVNMMRSLDEKNNIDINFFIDTNEFEEFLKKVF